MDALRKSIGDDSKPDIRTEEATYYKHTGNREGHYTNQVQQASRKTCQACSTQIRLKENAMHKVLTPFALCALILSSTGCDMLRPPVQAPEAAWSTYQGRLSEQCGEKHLDKMPAEKLNDLAFDTYKGCRHAGAASSSTPTPKKPAQPGPTAMNVTTPGFVQATMPGRHVERIRAEGLQQVLTYLLSFLQGICFYLQLLPHVLHFSHRTWGHGYS